MKTQIRTIFRFVLPSILLLVVPASRAQTWMTNSPLNVARWSHTATLLTNGQVLVAGGLIYNSDPTYFVKTNACELYDPASGTCALTGFMQESRYSHTATLLGNGQVLVTGGSGNPSSEVYDPPSGTWINLTSMSDERVAHSATLLADGTVLVAGGFNDDGGGELSSAEVYDPDSETWTSIDPMPYATDTPAAVLLPDGTVLVCGGSDGLGGSVTNAVIYDPTSQTWSTTAPMNEGRAGHSATLLPNGTVLVAGGGDNTAEIYDPVAGTWTYAGSMNDYRQYPHAVLLNNGQVLVLGGDENNTDVELYDSRNDNWIYTAPLVVPGNFQTATLLPNGRVVVTGGDASQYNGPPLATVQTYAANSPEIGHILIAHYPFDAGSFGDPYDSQFLSDTSGNGNNIQGPSSFDGTYALPTSDSVAGDSAVQFDGSNYYNLPNTLLTTVAGTYSLSLWLKTSRVSGGDADQGYDAPAIVWGGGVGSPYFDSEPVTLTGHKLGFYTGDDGSTLHSVTSIDSGAFTHIVITRDQPTGMKQIYINGVLDSSATGDTNFLNDSTDLLLGISYYHDGVAGVVDDVQFYNGLLSAGDVFNLYANPGSTVVDVPFLSLGLAVNDTNLVWTSFGDATWFGQNDVSYDGTGAAESGALGDSQSSTLQATVTGPGTLTFQWETLCADDGFDLEFDIDGIYQADLSNQNPWTQQTVSISQGTHTLTWISTSSSSSPGDAGYVDDVTFTPVTVNPPPSGTWTRAGYMNYERSLFTLTRLQDGNVLAAGGLFDTFSLIETSSSDLYNPATGTWTNTGYLDTSRGGFTATLLPNGKVLAAGGTSDNSPPLNSAELYDPATGLWTNTGPMVHGHINHTATVLGNGRVLVAGAGTSDLYNPATGTWTNSGAPNEARYGAAAFLLNNGRVLAFSGVEDATAELWDPVTGVWSYTTSMLATQYNVAATILADGRILAAGGFDSNGVTAVSEIYDPTTGGWTQTGYLNIGRDYAQAVLLNNGLVLLEGGVDAHNNAVGVSELYDPASGLWFTNGVMNDARGFSSRAVLLANGQVLAAGGTAQNQRYLSSAEVYTLPGASIILTMPVKQSGASFQFSFQYTSGASNTVYGSSDVSLPLARWTPLGSATETSPGQFQFTDIHATNSTRYYRVTSP